MKDQAIRQALSATRGEGPIYRDVAEAIATLIAGGRLPPGERLPPERDLAADCGFSRVTIRKAVKLLAERGLVVQRQGSGTYVAEGAARADPPPLQVNSMSEDLRRRGQAGRSVWLTRTTGAGNPHETAALGLEPGARVTRLARLRLANERPLAIERSLLPEDVLPDPLLLDQSLYALLEQTGQRPVRAVQRITAVNLTPRDAEMLGVFAAAAGLKLERTGYAADGRAVEHTETVFRGDAYDLVIPLGTEGAA